MNNVPIKSQFKESGNNLTVSDKNIFPTTRFFKSKRVRGRFVGLMVGAYCYAFECGTILPGTGNATPYKKIDDRYICGNFGPRITKQQK